MKAAPRHEKYASERNHPGPSPLRDVTASGPMTKHAVRPDEMARRPRSAVRPPVAPMPGFSTRWAAIPNARQAPATSQWLRRLVVWKKKGRSHVDGVM